MITSLANERIKAARKLYSRQQRRRSGRFLIEGTRLIGDALASGAVPEEVYFSPALLEANRDGQALLDALQRERAECTPVSPEVLASLAETVTPQGIVAVMRIPVLPAPQSPSLTLVLDGVADPGNAGTLLRSAEAAGADLVVFGPGTVDAFNDKVVRAAMGTHFRLPLRSVTTWDAVRAAYGAAASVYVAQAHAEMAYDAVDWRAPVALVVGNEANGPSEEARAVATAIAIPMRGPVESLNAAMAGTIILFEAARQRKSYVHMLR